MTATATTRDSVPIVDCSVFTQPNPSKTWLATAREIGSACEQYGFLVVSGHGVPATTIADMRQISREFFSLPLDEKLNAVASDAYRGYLPPESKSHANASGAPPDLLEKFSMSRFETHDEALAAGYRPGLERWFAVNVWPAEPRAMKALWWRYYDAVGRFAHQLMTAFAIALDLPADWFDAKLDRHMSNVAANHYPPQHKPPAPGQLRIAPHTDIGSLTLIPQDGAQGGLEIQHPASGEWLPVPSIPETFVVNIGDLMARWTNDRWVSTWHRVVNPPRARADVARLSTPFFLQPNFDAKIECLPSCCSAGRPPRYAPITAGEWARRAGRPADLKGWQDRLNTPPTQNKQGGRM